MQNNYLQNKEPIENENIEQLSPSQQNRLFELIKGTGNEIKKLGGVVGNKTRNIMADILLGKEAEQPTTVINPNGTMETGITNARNGGVIGFVDDFSQGAKENMSNAFSKQNLMPNNNKGFGYRLGEAFGTGARLLDNPLVRGAFAYGLSKYNGDYNPLEQGLIALGTNMQNKTNDRLYRQDLANQGIDTSNIRGFINSDVYKNISQANYRNNSLKIKQDIANAKDNTSRAKMIGDWLKNGQLSPEDAKVLIAQYGLTNADFQLSNDTRKTDSQIDLNQKRGEKLESDIAINDYILGSGNPTTGKVKVQAPNGDIYNVDANRVKEYINAGGKVVR